MQSSRLTLALDSGALSLPPEGRIAVFRPRDGMDLSPLPPERVVVVQGFRPDHDAFAARGWIVATESPADAAAAVVCVPRAKAEGRALIAAACALLPPGAPLVIDGQKTDGVDALLRDMRDRVPVGEAIAKAHGKIAVLANPGGAAFADWTARPVRTGEGFVIPPSGFSSDGVDAGSAALAAVLPQRLPTRVADLGAGWGYMAAQVLTREGVQEAHLIEAEHDSLEAARQNVPDPRARFHWADVTRAVPGAPFPAIVMNPPFHRGRDADPGLGRAFLAAAARSLTPSGTLWMVANRHLPYERALADLFREVEELPGPPAFKLFRATAPKTAPKPAGRAAPDAARGVRRTRR